MFKQKTVKAFSIVAIVLSSIGLLISILSSFLLIDPNQTIHFLFGILSWIILLSTSIVGYILCRRYKLYEDEYKKVGIRIYLVIIAFFLFFFVGLIVGLIISVSLLATVLALKLNYDDWENKYGKEINDAANTDETT